MDVPLVVARRTLASEKHSYVLFAYRETKSLKPALVETDLGDTVPDHLSKYLVSYPLNPSNGRRTDVPSHLRTLAVIDSTVSGTHRSSDVYFSVLAPLLKAFDLPHVYVATTGPHTIPNHASSFSSSSTVVFLAGDTSVHEFVNSLQPQTSSASMTVAIIPTGTGNAISESLGRTNGIADAISRLFLGAPIPLQSMKVGFGQGSTLATTGDPVSQLQSLVVTSWGFHASIVADSDEPEARKQGAARFQVAAHHNLTVPQDYKGTVHYRTKSWLGGSTQHKLDGPHSYVLFTFMTSLEKGFVISPKGDLSKLFLVQFNYTENNSDRIMEIMKAAYNKGSHTDLSDVTYHECDTASTNEDSPIAQISITDSDPRHHRVCVDGRIVNVKDKVELFATSATYKGWRLFIVS